MTVLPREVATRRPANVQVIRGQVVPQRHRYPAVHGGPSLMFVVMLFVFSISVAGFAGLALALI